MLGITHFGNRRSPNQATTDADGTPAPTGADRIGSFPLPLTLHIARDSPAVYEQGTLSNPRRVKGLLSSSCC
jgi:hypothetical protein